MQYASVLLFNAVVLTLDGNDAVASALALDGDRILAVGDRDGLASLILLLAPRRGYLQALCL